MRKLGAKHNEAAGFARTSKGFWRVAKHLGHKAGMTNEWLANEGLIEIKQEWWNVKFLRITACFLEGLDCCLVVDSRDFRRL